MPELAKIGDMVEYILEKYPQTRESDKALEITVWTMFYGVHNLVDLIKKEVPPSSTIRRWRRRFNQWGKYLPPEGVQRRRINNTYDYIKAFID
jgi:hypothetical protein